MCVCDANSSTPFCFGAVSPIIVMHGYIQKIKTDWEIALVSVERRTEQESEPRRARERGQDQIFALIRMQTGNGLIFDRFRDECER